MAIAQTSTSVIAMGACSRLAPTAPATAIAADTQRARDAYQVREREAAHQRDQRSLKTVIVGDVPLPGDKDEQREQIQHGKGGDEIARFAAHSGQSNGKGSRPQAELNQISRPG